MMSLREVYLYSRFSDLSPIELIIIVVGVTDRRFGAGAIELIVCHFMDWGKGAAEVIPALNSKVD